MASDHANVLESIKAFITERNLKPGDKLPTERELAERLGRSRHTVREALRSLEALSVVQIVQGSGIYVNDPSFSFLEFPLSLRLQSLSVEDLIVARETVELKIVALACLRCTAADEERLNAFIAYRATEDARRRYEGRFDFEFERLMGEIAGNEFLSLMQRLSHYMWLRVVRQKSDLLQDQASMQREHAAVAAAVCARDAEAAATAMRTHLNAVYRVLREAAQ